MSSPSVEDPQKIGDAVPPGYKKINDMLQVSNIRIGDGSSGTTVFKGSYDGLEVAVKRGMQTPLEKPLERELEILRKSSGYSHPNIVRYFYDTKDETFWYIALELCPATLADIMDVKRRDELRHIVASFVPKRALMEITSGLDHLHALQLVHRDIKPPNILVSKAGESGEHRMLISDFGVSKQLDFERLSTATVWIGSRGWRAPEVLRGQVTLDGNSAGDAQSGQVTLDGDSAGDTQSPTRRTQLADIFALGCLYYYVLTEGQHPFGDWYEREFNIMKNTKRLENLKDLVAVDAIEKMLSPETGDRPDTAACLRHPCLWGADKMLSFLQEASDRLQNNENGMLDALENAAEDVVGRDWRAALDPSLIAHLSKERQYNGNSVGDLLRLVRNMIYELPDDVRNELGTMPEGFLKYFFLEYFADRFPKLFLRVYNVVSSSSLRGEQTFESYFQLPEKSRPVLPL